MASNYVIKVSPATLTKMKQHYQDQLLSKKVPYTVFTAKVGTTTITAYQSGKVMFQGPTASQVAAQWEGTPAPKKTKARTNSAELPADFSQWSVIGSDEVGNGSYFGPLTVCAAYVAKDKIAKLKALGVRDSKELTDPQIRQLAQVIKTLIPYKLLTVPPAKYNTIQPRYNAVHMKVALHNQAIFLLLKEIEPEKPNGILIDQFTPAANYRKYVSSETNQVTEKLFFVTKGEQYHVAVAAASIISRAAFLEELDQATQELGFKVPSGAGTAADQAGANVLKKGGLALLSQYAKLHFANTEKAKKRAGM